MTEEEYRQLQRNVAGAKDRAKAFQGHHQIESLDPAQRPKPHKYRATPVTDAEDGYFHSTGEWQRWQQLKLLQQAGTIQRLRRQVLFKGLAYIVVLTDAKEGLFDILKRINWKVDFTYEENGHQVAEEFTSTPTMTARKKLQIQAFRLKYPDWELRITDRRILT